MESVLMTMHANAKPNRRSIQTVQLRLRNVCRQETRSASSPRGIPSPLSYWIVQFPFFLVTSASSKSFPPIPRMTYRQSPPSSPCSCFPVVHLCHTARINLSTHPAVNTQTKKRRSFSNSRRAPSVKLVRLICKRGKSTA